MQKIILGLILFYCTVSGGIIRAAEDSWRESFDKICIHTANAENLDKEALSKLIAESDTLYKTIESSSDPKRKLYLTRLRQCRNFFVFMQDIPKN